MGKRRSHDGDDRRQGRVRDGNHDRWKQLDRGRCIPLVDGNDVGIARQSVDSGSRGLDLRAVGRENCGTLPDFGNFLDYDRYLGVEELMPFAKAVRAACIELALEPQSVQQLWNSSRRRTTKRDCAGASRLIFERAAA